MNIVTFLRTAFFYRTPLMALADIFSSNEFIQRKFFTECIKDFIHSGLMGKIIWGKIVF